MTENTGLHIAPGVDVQVLPPPSNTPLGEMTIVPKINKQHGLGCPKIPQPLPHQIPLPRGSHHPEIRIPPNGNVIEIPHQNTPLLHQKIDELVARQNIGVKTRLSRGNREKKTRLPQKIHHPHIPLETTLAPPQIGMILKPLHADGRHDIAQPDKPIHHLLVNQGRIGIDLKTYIPVPLEKLEYVTPQEGLPPRKENEVNPHLLALGDHPVDDLQLHLLPILIVPRIAPIAAEVAPHGRTDEKGIGRIDPRARLEFLPPIGAHQELIDDEVGDDLPAVMRICLPQYSLG